MVRVLERIERERLREGVKCPAREGDAIKKGSEGRKIETLIGKILYTRTRFKCKRCGDSPFLVISKQFAWAAQKNALSISEVSFLSEYGINPYICRDGPRKAFQKTQG